MNGLNFQFDILVLGPIGLETPKSLCDSIACSNCMDNTSKSARCAPGRGFHSHCLEPV